MEEKYMGFFSPKISAAEMASVKNMLKQVNDCTKIINTTSNPEIYFSRLNQLFDLFLTLKTYEKYAIFKNSTPTKDLNILMSRLENSVNLFIDRSYENQMEKIRKLKTDKAKINSFKKYAEKMQFAFENSHNFWQGSTLPSRAGTLHYQGELYTDANLEYLNNVLSKDL